jgi:hypothetical protein
LENKPLFPSLKNETKKISYPSVSFEMNFYNNEFFRFIYLCSLLMQLRPQSPQPKPLTPSERAREYIRQKKNMMFEANSLRF